jgi:peptidyl-prolyl cis-trans isomerase A (cyclophilin A)
MSRTTVAVTLALALTACDSKPSEPVSSAQAATPPPPSAAAAADNTPPPTPRSYPGSARPRGADPLMGKWSLADATADIKGSGALIATLDTSKGKLTCSLLEEKAPVTVANFVGLATGKRAWLDPASGQWVNRPAYDGTTFHRIIKDFMIQGGDPKGDGSGEPGYVIPDELWQGSTHDRAGLLCMANRGPNTNGAQFFITDSSGPSVKNLDHLNSYTIFGECAPVDGVHAIANVQTGPRDKPVVPVVINSVKVARANPAK